MIFVLAGTKDAREIIDILVNKGHDVLASTTTKYGSSLLGSNTRLKVICKKLKETEMIDIVKKYNIETIIDATHPFAQIVSKNAIKTAKATNVRYLRFERKRDIIEGDNIYRFKTFEDVCESLYNIKENVLLTIGTKNLYKFDKIIRRQSTFIRVLPKTSSMEECERLGVSPRQIIGIQGPFTTNFNNAIYKQYNIRYMVTKDSGETGGLKQKINSAKQSGVNVLLIERPKIEYTNVYSDINELVNAVNK